jgi:hypothetical protein
MTMPPSSTFNRVEIEDIGRVRTMTKQQYCDLPMTDRVELLLAGRVRFYRDATEVPSSEALSSLKRGE